MFALVKLVRPILRPLFPDVPPDHPALGMIALNLTATVFGLGNAATPFGIKAMEELQKLNPIEGHGHQLDGHAPGDQHGRACSSSRRCCSWRSWAPRSTR